MAEWVAHEPTFQHTIDQGLARGGRASSEPRRPGAAAAASCSAVREGRATGRGGTPVGSVEAERHELAARLGRRRGARPAPGGADGATAAARWEGVEGGGAGAGQGPERVRLEQPALDAGAGGRRDRDRDRGPVSRRPRLEAAPAAGLELAEAGAAGDRARRGGDRALGARGVARDKKLARRKQAWIVFEDESGASLTPVVRRTWAPRGKTPVLRHTFNWKRISMAAALAYRWDGARSRLYFQTREGSYNEESLIEFVRELRRHFRGE